LGVIPLPNVVWAVDFMSETLYGGRRFRTFNVLDVGVRERLAIEIDTSLPAERVIRVLEQVVSWWGQPQAIRLDHGPEFLADRFITWCAERGIQLWHIHPGKPDQHALIERYNRTYRTEVLNASVFESLERSVPNGYSVIMKSGLMMRWRDCRLPRIGPKWRPELLP